VQLEAVELERVGEPADDAEGRRGCGPRLGSTQTRRRRRREQQRRLGLEQQLV